MKRFLSATLALSAALAASPVLAAVTGGSAASATSTAKPSPVLSAGNPAADVQSHPRRQTHGAE